jgi:hypothetical protein
MPNTPMSNDVLALRLRDAAIALQVSERTLWGWTKEGIAPHVRIGGILLFPVDVLRDWLRDLAAPKKEGPQL